MAIRGGLVVALIISTHLLYASALFNKWHLCIFQVDAMLHKLEKELDDVDLKIGDRWRILDRYIPSALFLVTYLIF